MSTSPLDWPPHLLSKGKGQISPRESNANLDFTTVVVIVTITLVALSKGCIWLCGEMILCTHNRLEMLTISVTRSIKLNSLAGRKGRPTQRKRKPKGQLGCVNTDILCGYHNAHRAP